MKNPSRYTSDLPPEQQAIRDKCFHPSGTFVEFKKEEVEQSIGHRFEDQVRKYPNRLAIKTGSHKLTYDQANKTANRLAHTILAQRGKGQEPIALLLEQGAALSATFLSVLKAGKIAVPLDPSYPPARTSYMLEDSRAGLILTNDLNFPLAIKLAKSGVHILNIDEIEVSVSEDNLGLSVSPDTVAYILYTSGSTGEPKGVFRSHRGSLHHIMTYTNTLHICAEDRLTLLTSVSGQAIRCTRASVNDAAGSKRVKVVHRKLIGLAAARRGSSLRTRSGQLAKAGCPAIRDPATVVR